MIYCIHCILSKILLYSFKYSSLNSLAVVLEFESTTFIEEEEDN